MDLEYLKDVVSSEVSKRVRNGEITSSLESNKMQSWALKICEWIFGKDTTRQMICYVLKWIFYLNGKTSKYPNWSDCQPNY